MAAKTELGVWAFLAASLFLAAMVVGCGRARAAASGPVATVTLQALPGRVTAGSTVDVAATARTAGGQPVAGAPLQAFVNGKAWGAPEITNAQGRAVLPLPLPDTGTDTLRVATQPRRTAWIWASGATPGAPLYLSRTFQISAKDLGSALAAVTAQADLDIAADRIYRAYVNGHLVATGSATTRLAVKKGISVASLLHTGSNVLAVEVWGGGHPGLAARLSLRTFHGNLTVSTDGSWQAFSSPPMGWPADPASGHALPLRVVAPAGGGTWMGRPGVGGSGLGLNPLPLGQPVPSGWIASPQQTLQVTAADITVPSHPQHLVGIEYEPWFTPLNLRWKNAEGIPLLGLYQSTDASILRQHALWLDRAGVNFLLIDWSNNLWGKTSWSQRAPNVRQLVGSTTDLMNTYATMRSEGLPTPQVTLLLGLDNGPTTTTTALNEEMAWIYQNYVQNPNYKGLWVQYLGKPLMVIFNGGGPGETANQPPVSTADFTVRWMGSQLQSNQLASAGYWSWMDGTVHPVVTSYHGAPEALTVTPAFFGAGGWTGAQAMARLGGTTYLREFAEAMQVQPHFLLINQFNEFAGEAPSAALHADTYTEQLSDDIEPTSPTDCGYVSCGGWGFYYLNLTRALVDMYHEAHPQSTLLAVGSPLRGGNVCGSTLQVNWSTVGAQAAGFDVLLDGRRVASGLRASPYTLHLEGIGTGTHTLTVRAVGATNRYSLSRTSFAQVLSKRVPVSVQTPFTYTGACPGAGTGTAQSGEGATHPQGVDIQTVGAASIGPQHAPVGPLQQGQTLAEVFRVPAGLTSVGATTPTWDHKGSGATLVLRAGAGIAGRILTSQTFTNATDNGWLTVRLGTPLPAGTYTLEMEHPTGADIGWWGSATMVPGDYALNNGQQQQQELVVQFLFATGG